MRVADPNELTARAVPALAATIATGKLSALFPVRLTKIDDPDATREPSRGALVQLESGDYIVLFYGEDSQQLTVEFPESANFTTTFQNLLEEVPLERSQIIWLCPDLQSETTGRMPGQVFQIKMHPAFESAAQRMQLAPAEANALMHLVMKLPRVARSAAMVHDAVHSLRLSSHRVLSDGSEVAPLQVFYLVDEGAKTILIMGVSRPESDQVLLTEGTLRHLISRASSSTSELYDLPATLDISSEGNVRTIGEWIQKASEALRRAS